MILYTLRNKYSTYLKDSILQEQMTGPIRLKT